MRAKFAQTSKLILQADCLPLPELSSVAIQVETRTTKMIFIDCNAVLVWSGTLKPDRKAKPFI